MNRSMHLTALVLSLLVSLGACSPSPVLPIRPSVTSAPEASDSAEASASPEASASQPEEKRVLTVTIPKHHGAIPEKKAQRLYQSASGCDGSASHRES